MKRAFSAVHLTLWANRLVAAVVFVLLFTLPALLQWYSQFRFLNQTEYTAIMIAFYFCAVAVGIALWNMDSLLRAILESQVFTHENVRKLRLIRWCCFAVAVICIPAACCYYPLVFMVLVMGFLSLAVTVVVRVMAAAVALREENDLTI